MPSQRADGDADGEDELAAEDEGDVDTEVPQAPWLQMVARLIEAFGYQCWFSKDNPTRDGFIPMDWFDLYMQELDAHGARQELMNAQSTALGTAIAYNGKEQSVKETVRQLVRQGFPTILVPRA